MVRSRSNRRLVVFREGVEIRRSRIELRQPGAVTGNRAYIVGEGSSSMADRPQWFSIGTPWHFDQAGEPVPAQTLDQLEVPREFVAHLLPLLKPGTVLLVTDAQILPQPAGGAPWMVIDSEPPE